MKKSMLAVLALSSVVLFAGCNNTPAEEEVVVEMLKKDISPELIAECVKLPLEKVLELQEKSNVNA